MYKKKELLGILEICKDHPEIDTRCLQQKIKNGLNVKKPPKLNTKDKEAMAKLYDICIHNGTLQYPARKAMERIPSKLQRKQRCLADLIKPNNIVQTCGKI